jgi:hypothetical protein
VYDAQFVFIGADVRSGLRATRISSFHFGPVPRGGFSYRIWLMSDQHAIHNLAAQAASGFTYDFGSLFFVFS